jgi:paraquat-inducible protein A
MGSITGRTLIKRKPWIISEKAGLITCHTCRLVCKPATGNTDNGVCPRCHTVLHPRKSNSLVRTWILVVAAFCCYIPANMLAITHTSRLTHTQSDTIISGVMYFMRTGSWAIALIILVASVVVPILKLVVLTYLLISIHLRSRWRPAERTRLFRTTEAIGRWSMVDIFVVTILVALVKVGFLASIQAGPGAIYFAAVVVLTMLAANSFDVRLIWDAWERRR